MLSFIHVANQGTFCFLFKSYGRSVFFISNQFSLTLPAGVLKRTYGAVCVSGVDVGGEQHRSNSRLQVPFVCYNTGAGLLGHGTSQYDLHSYSLPTKSSQLSTIASPENVILKLSFMKLKVPLHQFPR